MRALLVGFESGGRPRRDEAGAGVAVFSALPWHVLGGLLGALAYGTYDLTNYATLKFFTGTMAAIDIAYGTVTIALSAQKVSSSISPRSDPSRV